MPPQPALLPAPLPSPRPAPTSANDTLYLQIAERIAQPIRAGTLARGERIPSVRELARQQGVSLSTVVQAYRTLEDARLIEARPRSGYFVAARAPRLPELSFAVLALGDSSYVNFCNGGKQFDALLQEQSAQRVGEMLLIDASEHPEPESESNPWVENWGTLLK